MGTELFLRVFPVVSAIVLFAGTAVAADVNGKWIARTSSPSGSKGERIFSFQATGNTLTGTIINQQSTLATFEPAGRPKMTGILTTQAGGAQELSEGKINGDAISFVTVEKRGDMEFKTVCNGKLSGSEINFTAETILPAGFTPPGGPSGQGPKPQAMVAKRLNP